MDREKDYRYGWLDSLYLHSGFDTAHSGHGKVEDNEVRSARLCKFNGFPACFRLFAQIVIRFALEQLAQHLPHAGVVIRYENDFRHGKSSGARVHGNRSRNEDFGYLGACARPAVRFVVT